jgi:hypothetical protein
MMPMSPGSNSGVRQITRFFVAFTCFLLVLFGNILVG